MEELIAQIKEILVLVDVISYIRAAVVLVIGLIAAKVVSRTVEKTFRKYFNVQRGFIAGRASYYTIAVLVIITAFRQLGFDFTVLLGAAGVLTVAIAFASQTSASNVISGLFLMVEEPFAVGDLIKVGETMGEVLSVDLLSVKLRTLDNLFVRLPNEMMIKSEVTNVTRFPIRRADIHVGVAYKEDLERVRDILMEIADTNPLCLDEPKPLFIFKGYGNSSLDMQFSVWTETVNFIDFRNSVYLEIKRAFDRYGIEIPFPHLTLYTGSVTEPYPVRIIKTEAKAKPEYPEPPKTAMSYKPTRGSGIVEEN